MSQGSLTLLQNGGHGGETFFCRLKRVELSDTFKQAARKKIKKKTVQGTGLRVLVRGGERRAGRSRDEKEGREAEHEDRVQAGKSETSGAAYIV